MMEEDIESILQKAIKENKRLTHENEKLKNENHRLNQRLQDGLTQSNKQMAIKQKSQERIDLFKSLFKGRNDVFAYRWVKKNGKAGYSPARKANKNDFYPLTESVFYEHLTGKRTIGLYPLLVDNTCCFLAIDFDKKGWQRDAGAFMKTCEKFGVPASIERSRSGNGCHVWIFFCEPIPAGLARNLGNVLLSYTVKANLDSYDRMFPNQDTLPKGKFGNLIALPLQAEPRKNHNSVFVDENFNAYSDQWLYLSSVKKMSKKEIQWIVGDNNKDDLYVKESVKAVPEKMNVIYKNGIYISKEEVPKSFIREIAKLAQFSNPAYYKAQKKRLSTKEIPRTIDCSGEENHYFILPRGCMANLKKLLNEKSIYYTLDDQSFSGKPIQVEFQGKLFAQQEEALQMLSNSNTGILEATTGFGKTVVASSLIASRKVNTLVIVHRKQLIDQWREHLSTFLNIEGESIGQIGGGKNTANGIMDIATIQSLKNESVLKGAQKYGQIIVDECHHFAAFTFEKVLKKCDAKYVHGLTATPKRKDGLEAIIKMQVGPIRYKVSAKEQAKVRPLKHILVPRFTSFKSKEKEENIQRLYGELALDEKRNNMIFDDVLKELDQGSAPIVITERMEHVEKLAEKFRGFTKNLFILTGQLSKKEEENRLRCLSELPDDQERLIIATGKYIGEGFDNKRLDTLFLTMPISWKGTLQQYAGRIHRMHEKKTVVKVYDYVDQKEAILEKMYENRQKGYKALGYKTAGNGSEAEEVSEQMKLF